MSDFWQRTDALLAAHDIVIDRPKGSHHPRVPSIIYPLNYGYLKGTSGGDGHEVDVWKGSLSRSLLVAVICTVDSVKNDVEVKLLVDCTDTEIDIIGEFYNQRDVMSGMVVTRK